MNWGWKSSSSISRHWPRFQLAGRMLAFVLVCWRMSSGSCGNSREQLVRLRGLCTQMWHIDCRLSDLVCQCIAFSPTWNCSSNGSDSMRHCHRQLNADFFNSNNILSSDDFMCSVFDINSHYLNSFSSQRTLLMFCSKTYTLISVTTTPKFCHLKCSLSAAGLLRQQKGLKSHHCHPNAMELPLDCCLLPWRQTAPVSSRTISIIQCFFVAVTLWLHFTNNHHQS